jgi:hypothetical protein
VKPFTQVNAIAGSGRGGFFLFVCSLSSFLLRFLLVFLPCLGQLQLSSAGARDNALFSIFPSSSPPFLGGKVIDSGSRATDRREEEEEEEKEEEEEERRGEEESGLIDNRRAEKRERNDRWRERRGEEEGAQKEKF